MAPGRIWHKEMGAPATAINEPSAGFVLTPQAFSTSHLLLGPVLHHPGADIISQGHTRVVAPEVTPMMPILGN